MNDFAAVSVALSKLCTVIRRCGMSSLATEAAAATGSQLVKKLIEVEHEFERRLGWCDPEGAPLLAATMVAARYVRKAVDSAGLGDSDRAVPVYAKRHAEVALQLLAISEAAVVLKEAEALVAVDAANRDIFSSPCRASASLTSAVNEYLSTIEALTDGALLDEIWRGRVDLQQGNTLCAVTRATHDGLVDLFFMVGTEWALCLDSLDRATILCAATASRPDDVQRLQAARATRR